MLLLLYFTVYKFARPKMLLKQFGEVFTHHFY